MRNIWVPATPDCAFLFFLSQGAGAPDPARSLREYDCLAYACIHFHCPPFADREQSAGG